MLLLYVCISLISREAKYLVYKDKHVFPRHPFLYNAHSWLFFKFHFMCVLMRIYRKFPEFYCKWIPRMSVFIRIASTSASRNISEKIVDSDKQRGFRFRVKRGKVAQTTEQCIAQKASRLETASSQREELVWILFNGSSSLCDPSSAVWWTTGMSSLHRALFDVIGTIQVQIKSFGGWELLCNGC